MARKQPLYRDVPLASILQIVLLISATLLCTLTLSAQKVAKVVVETPGSLAQLVAALPEQPVKALKVEGKINGKDIAELRRLAGGTFDVAKVSEGGTLLFLDLKRASFFADKEKYCFLNEAIPAPHKVGKKMFSRCPSLQFVVLPTGVTTIDDSAFEESTSLREVHNTSGIKELGWAAFKGCTALSVVTFSEALTTIRGKAFSGCTALRGFLIPSSVKDLGSHAFEQSGLRFVSLPKGATDLGFGLFKDCTALLEARINAPIDLIPMSLFSGCSALREVSLPPEIATISESAFEGCRQLSQIVLPARCNHIQGYAFFGCDTLRRLVAHSTYTIMAPSAFSEKNVKCMTLFVPKASVEDYKSTAPWSAMSVNAIEDNLPLDKVCLEDDFSSYLAQVGPWKGSDMWTVDHGAYIKEIAGNKVLTLGDNEGDGKVISKALDLSLGGGVFRLRFAADGWNDFHSSFLIEAKDKEGNRLSSRRVVIPKPRMGEELRHFEVALSGGLSETYIHLSTSSEGRIVLLDDVKIFYSSTPLPQYFASREAFDFGRVAQGEEAPDQYTFFFGRHLTKAPQVKVLSPHLGVFSVDSEIHEEEGRIRVMLNSDKGKGTFRGFLQIDYDGVNVLMIPLKAIVEDPENVFDLDDSKPVTALDEDFNAQAKLPAGWKTLALEGERTWMMRSTGVGGNRYPAIDARGNVAGKVHSLLILPALDFAGEALKGKELAFDLAAIKSQKAQLRLVRVDKKGAITLLKELTADADFDWKELTFALSSTVASGTAFLAFEYIGEAEKATTVYRVDNVKIRATGASIPTFTQTAVFATGEGLLTIKGLSGGLAVTVYGLNGEIKASKQSDGGEIRFTLPRGSYIVKWEGREASKVIIP